MKEYKKKPVQSWKDKFDLGEHWFRQPTKAELTGYISSLLFILGLAAFTNFAGSPWF